MRRRGTDLERVGTIQARSDIAEISETLELAAHEIDEGRSPRRKLLRAKQQIDDLLRRLGARTTTR